MTSVKTWFIEWLARDATALAAGNGYDGTSSPDVDARNAIVHTRVSADYTYEFDRESATLAGDLKEYFGSSTTRDEYRDQFNNEVGRRIAEYAKANSLTQAELDDLVIDALNNGKLIVDEENDSRITNNEVPDWTAPSENWEDSSAGRNYDHEIPGTGSESDPLIPARWLGQLPNAPLTPFDPAHFPDFGASGPNLLPDWVPGVTSPFGLGVTTLSPLVLDVDGSGTIELAALNGAGSVYWDIDSDGFKEATGWTTGGDGLLCIDLNSDGIVTGHNELFGSQTGASNGYVALAAYDSNSSGAITSADTQFSNLRIWVDANADGYSQAGELHTLTSLGITSISTSYSNVNYTIAGNAIKQESTFVMNGNTYTSVDAWFAYDNVNSEYAGSFTLDIRTLFLPNLRGYGTLPDLHIAMSLDEDLLEMVQDLAGYDLATLADPGSDLQGSLTDIMFKWAGVEGVSPTSRGAYVDARKLEFLEKFMGQDYVQSNSNVDPPVAAAPYIEQAWKTAMSTFGASLLLQSGMNVLYPDYEYNPLSDDVTMTLRFDTTSAETMTGTNLDEIYIFYPGDSPSAGDVVWETNSGGTDTILLAGVAPSAVKMWTDVYGNLNIVSGSDTISVHATADGSPASLVSSYVEKIAFDDGTMLDLTQGLTMTDTDTAHNIYGSQQSDIINGAGGNDLIYGFGDDDTIAGGTGADNLTGGGGNDSYIYSLGDSNVSAGTDALNEYSGGGTDSLIFGAGIDPNNVRIWSDINGFLTIQYSSTDQVYVRGGFSTDVTTYLERIVFDDSTVWDLTQGLIMTDTDTAHSYHGSAQNDMMDGRGGNDQLSGYGGNDIMFGGADDDYVRGGDGNDILDGGSGGDTLRGDGGTDTASYASATAGVTVTLAMEWSVQNTVGSGYDTLIEVENLTGSAYNDTLTGNSGNNTIHGGGGTNSLTGGGGADIFAFDPDTTMNNIQDFSTAQSDKLDISALIDLYDPITHAITDWVQITTSGSNSLMAVDIDGLGSTYSFQQVATIAGVTGLTDEAALVTAGTLIV